MEHKPTCPYHEKELLYCRECITRLYEMIRTEANEYLSDLIADAFDSGMHLFMNEKLNKPNKNMRTKKETGIDE